MNWVGQTAATCGSITDGAGENADRIRSSAAELVALAPDILYAVGGESLVALLEATRTIPIVFAAIADPVGSGFVDSLARPGGNVTGLLLFEYVIAGKWLELLKQIAPALTRAAVIREPNTPAGAAQWAVIQATAPSIGVELSLINMRDARSIEPDIAAVAFPRSSKRAYVGRITYAKLAPRDAYCVWLHGRDARNRR